jgi:hypothetical protein
VKPLRQRGARGSLNSGRFAALPPIGHALQRGKEMAHSEVVFVQVIGMVLGAERDDRVGHHQDIDAPPARDELAQPFGHRNVPELKIWQSTLQCHTWNLQASRATRVLRPHRPRPLPRWKTRPNG